MDNTVISPIAGQTIVSSTDDKRHDQHRVHFVEHEILREVSAGFAGAALAAGTTQGAVKDARYDVVTQVSTAAAASALAAAKTDAVVAGHSAHTNEKLAGGFDRAASDACRIEREIAAGRELSVSGFKGGEITAYQLASQARLDASTNASASQLLLATIGNAAQVQATSNFNLLNVAATGNQYALLLDSEKHASASALRDAVNTATILAEQKACCCSMEREMARLTAITIAENDKTRQQMVAQRLEDERFARVRLDNAYNVLAGRTTPASPPIT